MKSSSPDGGSTSVPAGPNGHPTAASAFALSLKSVNHRFLDLHFRLPSGTDSLEMQLRRLLKEKMARGHVEVSLSLERTTSETFSLNREIVGGYIAAFRAAAAEFSLAAEPDLNAVLRIPGALDSANDSADGEIEAAVMAKIGEALDRLNQMREEEGRRHRPRTARPHGPPGRGGQESCSSIAAPYCRTTASGCNPACRSCWARPSTRSEFCRRPRCSSIAATFRKRSSASKIMCSIFWDCSRQGGEIGKKLDFLLQEMNREANTLLSKTSGLAGEALKITEAGLAMKAEIEKSREQVQNLE